MLFSLKDWFAEKLGENFMENPLVSAVIGGIAGLVLAAIIISESEEVDFTEEDFVDGLSE